MDKSDVKAIMARFQTGGEPASGTPGVRPKPPIQPTLSSGQSVPFKKPLLETSLSGGATTTSTAPKPFIKSGVNPVLSAPEIHGHIRQKNLASRFESTQETNKVNFKVPVKPKPPDSSQEPETKVLFPKPPPQKPSSNITAGDLKTLGPKPSASAKPTWARDGTKSDDNNANQSSTLPKTNASNKPKSSVSMLRQQLGESIEDSAKPLVLNKKPSFRIQNNFSKAEDGNTESVPVQKPVATQKPTFPKRPPAQAGNDDPSAPKKKPLPNTYALGSAPAKPNRPPKVNLEKYRDSEAEADGSQQKNASPPPPPAAHPSTQAPPPPTQPLPPSLPPRPSGPPTQDENYDDVESFADPFGGQNNKESGSDGEIYEDLDEVSSAAELSQPPTKNDLKMQKEREKKEKEAVKKFKLTQPLQVLQKGKAKADCKAGKSDLCLKKGDAIDIIRISDNPEGKWLGRNQDGCFGFVKTEMVQIDFNSLKSKNLFSAPCEDLYDDVESRDDKGSMNGQWVLPPPPDDDNEDVYDDIPDSNPISPGEQKPLVKQRHFMEMLKSSIERKKSQLRHNDIPPPAQFTQDENKGSSQEIYDDVDACPNNPISASKPKVTKTPEDPKKQKKLEKEEKEFRKKFKYEGEIRVLHQASVACNKKGSGKELSVQAGELLDVIHKSDAEKYICRNKEGKFGYVLASNIQADEEVYDDIGEDCIYDND